MKYITLNNNLKMPIIGLGTYPLNRIALLKTILNANKFGCKSFDTSSAYGNEWWLGLSLKLLELYGTRDIFITSKLSNTSQRKGDIRKALLTSMKKLKVKQLDLYLMHWPNPDTYLDSWKEMEKLYKEGLVKAIGVCNFHVHHLEKLLEVAEIIPAINQIELHPLLSQESLRLYCKSKGIQVQAYSPVARMDSKLISHSVLMELAKKYNKTVPQIILRWDIQNEIITIPKSGNKDRIKENLDVFDFELTKEEIKKIDAINEDYRVRYNPDTVDYFKV
ncbi:aldo/keto reductase [Arcobacter sp. YIC-464]|uniref:aldo/keto reductase n=1 Tax=Arcobacter sp. YIC-464 TaxID=3376631 RepID=UPI003C1DE430